MLDNIRNFIYDVTHIAQLREQITDTQIRVKDIQDRIYDVIYSHSHSLLPTSVETKRAIEDLQNTIINIQDRIKEVIYVQKNTPAVMPTDIVKSIKDASIRVNDIQDRVYDIRWQQKTSNSQRDLQFWQIYKRPEESTLDAQLRFFHSLPQATGAARKSQLVLACLMKKVHDVCEKHGLKYWLNFGSLIGAIRHSGFIPWDDDIDLGMMREDAVKLINILKQDKELFPRYIFANTKENGVLRLCQFRWQEYVANIDIFLYDYCRENSDEAWKFMRKQREKLLEAGRAYPVKSVNTKVVTTGNIQDDLKKLYVEYYSSVQKKLRICEEEAPYVVWGFDNGIYSNQDIHLFVKEIFFPLKQLSFEGYMFNVPNHYMEYIDPMYADSLFSLPSDMLSHKHVKFTQEQMEALEMLYSKHICNAI